MKATSVVQRPDLKRSAAVISRNINQHLARVRRDAEVEAKRQRETRARWEREQAEKDAAQARSLTQRIPLANKGLRRLLELGSRKPIQKIVSALERVQTEFLFFDASRPSGDAWDDDELATGTRDVKISFVHLGVIVRCGSIAAGLMTCWNVLHESVHPDAVVRIDEDHSEGIVSIDEFLDEISSPFRCDLTLVQSPEQRVLEWDPQDAAFEVLVRCAHQSRVNTFLSQCLQRIQVSSGRK
ncbi:hypothetical protein A2765_06700 [Candidatus Kaiserbacteria bacterium RIFCSPHIGHO2_01_FULL_56_24]|uniref:Uncharacterized protein n=1 Tax=Candidatus Kaiserbacteria bacterium RIFCSPHIGHO2_01_FULL_56_24 TaxID=1798487 RepID=A0A1F6DD05_9BACT|nr:MAG: hypothetical protein A2765_06700 [Candidatus Kaiserbacteria bacterium RIFCSPHIGHO2_01_FULL_56_24]